MLTKYADLLKYNSYKFIGVSFDFLSSFNFLCTVDKPTRLTKISAISLDHVYATNLDAKVSTKTITSGISDHFDLLTIVIKEKSKTPRNLFCKTKHVNYNQLAVDFESRINDILTDEIKTIQILELIKFVTKKHISLYENSKINNACKKDHELLKEYFAPSKLQTSY